MADLTLSEYNGIPEKKLGHVLQTEARKMFDSDAINKHSEDGVSKMKIVKYLSKLQQFKKDDDSYSFQNT